MNRKIIFIHGYTASSKADWYPNIIPLLDELKLNYSIPDLPGGKHPQSREWIKIIKNEVNHATLPVILVGHSLGTRAILLYLNQFQRKVNTIFLIAPVSNEKTNANREGGNTFPDFFKFKIDMERVKKLADRFIVIHSKDDLTLDYAKHGLTIANELDAKLITFEDRNHFSEPANAPTILEILRKELGF